MKKRESCEIGARIEDVSSRCCHMGDFLIHVPSGFSLRLLALVKVLGTSISLSLSVSRPFLVRDQGRASLEWEERR